MAFHMEPSLGSDVGEQVPPRSAADASSRKMHVIHPTAVELQW